MNVVRKGFENSIQKLCQSEFTKQHQFLLCLFCLIVFTPAVHVFTKQNSQNLHFFHYSNNIYVLAQAGYKQLRDVCIHSFDIKPRFQGDLLDVKHETIADELTHCCSCWPFHLTPSSE